MGTHKKRTRAIPEGQEALPFRSGHGGGLLAYASPWERRVFGLISAVFFVVIALYVYFVITSIVHVAARQELAGKIANTKSSLSTLETQYLTKTAGITESYARSIGYVTASNQVFVVRENTVSFHAAH